MKISEMKTDQDMDVVCELIDIIDDIMSDSEFVSELSTVTSVFTKKNITNQEAISKLWSKRKVLVKLLLKSKREEMYKIISILSDKSVQEIKSQLLIKTLLDGYEAFSDKELMLFFKQQVKSNVEN
ncbi:MAG: hypothetical protein R3Y09_06660 [Clostridia bacterium]